MAPFGPLYFGQQTPRRAGPTIIGEAEGGMLVAGSKAQRSEPYRQRICRPRACVTGCELVLRLQSGVGGTERVLYPVDGFPAAFVRVNRDNVEAHHAICILRSHRCE